MTFKNIIKLNYTFHNEFYMDDGMSGEWNLDDAHELADNLESVLLKGGLKFK